MNGVILNADALQIYADLDVLSARPSAADLSLAPHRLYGVLDGAERGSVARWLELVHQEIKAVLCTGQTPIVTGGTGLYLRALLQGIAEIPSPPPELVADLGAQFDAQGGDAFLAQLAKEDPQAAATLRPSDRQRLVRALAVVRATGQPLHQWQQATPAFLPDPSWTFETWVVTLPREIVYDRCNKRFEVMVQNGALDEVQRLLARNLAPDLPVMKAVGVPELAAYLNGTTTLQDAMTQAATATRHYAKRQMTWFRHQLPNAKPVPPNYEV